MELHHATVICRARQGVILLGASGSGKSDLALRLIQHGCELVADDQVQIEAGTPSICAPPPRPTCKACLEIRGVGIVKMPLPLSTRPLSPSRAAANRMPERGSPAGA